VCANDDKADISGYLQQYKNRSWKQLWFVVKDKVLYTFRAVEVRLGMVMVFTGWPKNAHFSLDIVK